MRTIAPRAHLARRRQGVAHRFVTRHLPALLLFAALSSLAACFSGRGTIGAVISQDDDTGRLLVREVPPDLAAARADLKPGDEILLIDGQDVRAMTAKQINAALSGEVDSKVKLTLIRQEQVLRVTLKRTEAQRLLNRPGKSQQSAP